MANAYSEIAFTDAVKAVQEELGSAEFNAAHFDGPKRHEALAEREAAFLAAADSFYLASVSETGWPYIQHRGGPQGFVRVLGPKTIGWAEFAGNRQYLTTGNLRGSDKVSLFFMDYARRARLKLLGRARVIGKDDPLFENLKTDGYRARIERAMVVEIDAFDWNCPQHIPQRYSAEDVATALDKLTAEQTARIAALEAEIASLKSGENDG